MRGLDSLLQIRRQGLKPAGLVRFVIDPASYAYEGWVVCDEGDKPGAVDLRPFYDLGVFVTGCDFDAVEAWARAVAAAGAKHVAVLAVPKEGMPSRGDAAILKHNGEMLA